MEYNISQKFSINLPILSEFICLFSVGKVVPHSVKGNYTYLISGFKNCQKIYDYFNQFEFKSKKGNTYIL
jgi:LAGLIDADG endonuclease